MGSWFELGSTSTLFTSRLYPMRPPSLTTLAGAGLATTAYSVYQMIYLRIMIKRLREWWSPVESPHIWLGCFNSQHPDGL